MTSQNQANIPPDRLGARLKQLRTERHLHLREVAPEVAIDTALLSKIENGTRLPTQRQTAALAAYFDLPPDSLEALRLVEKFWRENRDNPAAAQAAALIEETAAAYGVNKSVKNRSNKMGRTSPSKRET